MIHNNILKTIQILKESCNNQIKTKLLKLGIFSLNARLQLSENSQAMIGLGLNDRNFIITSPLSQYWLYGSATHELRYFSRFRYRELLIPLAYRKHVKSGQWDVYNKVLLLSSLAFEGFYKSEPLSRELTTIEQRIWSSSLMISTQLERSIGNSLLIRFEPYASLARVRQDDKVVSFLDNNALSSLDEFGIKVSLDLTLATFSFKDKKSAEFIDQDSHQRNRYRLPLRSLSPNSTMQ